MAVAYLPTILTSNAILKDNGGYNRYEYVDEDNNINRENFPTLLNGNIINKKNKTVDLILQENGTDFVIDGNEPICIDNTTKFRFKVSDSEEYKQMSAEPQDVMLGKVFIGKDNTFMVGTRIELENSRDEAIEIDFNNSNIGIESTNVQNAIDEIVTSLQVLNDRMEEI